MSVTHWLHSLYGNAAPLTPERLFDAALRNGYEVAMNSRHYGSIEPGMPADFVVFDYDAMAYDVIEGMVEELDVLLTRATRNHVKHVFVNGRPIVQNGGTAGLDLVALEQELLALAHAAGSAMRALRPIMQRSQGTFRAFYESTATSPAIMRPPHPRLIKCQSAGRIERISTAVETAAQQVTLGDGRPVHAEL
jgi:hypothetical protein